MNKFSGGFITSAFFVEKYCLIQGEIFLEIMIY